jgi:hypothetical protein
MPIPLIAAVAAKAGLAAKAAKVAKLAKAAKAAKASKVGKAINIAQSTKNTKPKLSIGMLADKGGNAYMGNTPSKSKYTEVAKGFAKGAAEQSGEPIELSEPSQSNISHSSSQSIMPSSQNAVYAEQIRKLKSLQ